MALARNDNNSKSFGVVTAAFRSLLNVISPKAGNKTAKASKDNSIPDAESVDTRYDSCRDLTLVANGERAESNPFAHSRKTCRTPSVSSSSSSK